MNAQNGSPEATSETLSSHSPKERKTVMELAHQIVSEQIESHRYNEAELLREVNKKNPDEILRTTRSKMKVKWQETPGDYLDYTEQDINSRVSNKDIIDIYKKRLIDLKRWQESLYNKIISLYKKEAFVLTTRDGARNSQILDELVGSLNEYEIIHLMKSPTRLSRKIKSVFESRIDNLEVDGSQPWQDYITRLGMTENDLTIQARNVCTKLATPSSYIEAGDMRIFLDMISDARAPIATKREIMRDILSIHFPDGIEMKEAIKLGLISHPDALRKTKTQLARWMQDPWYFDTNDLEQKAERNTWAERVCSETNLTSLSIADIVTDDSKIDSLLSKEIRHRSDWIERKMAIYIEDAKLESGSQNMAAENMTYQSFLDKIDAIKNPINGEPKVRWLSHFGAWSVLHFTIGGDSGKEEDVYLKIDANDIKISVNKIGQDGEKEQHAGIRIVDMTRDGGIWPAWSGSSKEYTYRRLYEYISQGACISWEVISTMEFAQRTAKEHTGSDKIDTIYHEDEEDIDSLEKLESIIGFKPEKDMMLTFQVDNNTNERIKIESINEGAHTVTLNDWSQSATINFQKFIEVVKRFDIKSWDTLGSLDDFWNLMKKMPGFEDVIIEDGALYRVTTEWWKEKKTKIEYLKNGADEVLEIQSVDSDGINYKYGKLKKDWDDSTTSSKANPKIPKLKSATQKAWFLEALCLIDKEGEWFQAYITSSEKTGTVDDELPHFHSYPLAKFLSGTSVGDMMKAFEIYTHAWEHKLEKNSKFNSAKFADKYFSRLMPESFRWQLKSEAYAVQNGAMDEVLKMLEETMSGKDARLYVRKKILLNSNARFEEILAGMLYMGKKTGQLYPEELSDLGNSKAWFHQLARSMWYKTLADRQALWEQAAKKSPKGEFAVESDVIERVLKLWEGKEMRIPPNIAPRFAGSITEGIKGQEEKGEAEVHMLSSLDQMNDYALSKLNVGEWYKALKTLGRIYGKNGGAVGLNTIPFTLLMSNMPEYLGTDFCRKIHSEATGKDARSTHALAFGNDLNHVKTYRNMVWEAAEELSRRGNSWVLAALSEIEKTRKDLGKEDHHNKKETEANQKKFVNSLFKFWQKYGKDLHPILQMTDPYIQTHQDKDICRRYNSRIGMIAGMQRWRTNIKETDQFGEWNWQYTHTPPMDYKNRIAASMADVSTSQWFDMDQVMYEKGFVPSVLGTFNYLRALRVEDFPEWKNLSKTTQDENLRTKKKELFRDYLITTLYFLRTKINTKVGYERAKWKNYLQDFAEHGLIFKEWDFINRRTKPQNVHISENGDSWFNEEECDPYDEKRINELFETFLTANPTIKRSVRARNRTASAFSRAMNTNDYMSS